MSSNQNPTPVPEAKEKVEDEVNQPQDASETTLSNDKEPGKSDTPPNEETENKSATSGGKPEAARITNVQTVIDSDDDASSSSSYSVPDDLEENVEAASHLTKYGIFKAYARKQNRKIQTPTRKKGAKGPRLVDSLVEYVQTLESRIESLEEKLEENRRSSYDSNSGSNDEGDADDESDAENTTDAAPGATPSSPRLKIRFFNIKGEIHPNGAFKDDLYNTSNTYRSAIGPKHFIRVVYRWKNEKPPGYAQQVASDFTPDLKDIDVLGIRVNSKCITSFYEAAAHYSGLGSVLEVSRPFRCIIRHLTELRDHVAVLEHRWRTNPSSEGHSAPQDLEPKAGLPFPPPPPPPVAHQRREAFVYFREYLKFIEIYLEPQIRLFDEYRSSHRTKISFENLWMLYNFNDTIYCPSKRSRQVVLVPMPPSKPGERETPNIFTTKSRLTPQAYRILYTEGGVGIYSPTVIRNSSIFLVPERPPLRDEDDTTTITMSAKQKFSELTICCFSVDFDGEKYTPDTELFVFRPFEGEIDITSLEAYPIRFHRHKEQTSEMLLERGRKFMDMTSISHMTYEGLTVGDDREEVVSSAIIDIKLYYQENEALRPARGPVRMPPLRRHFNQIRELVSSWRDCDHGRSCRRWTCTRDVYGERYNINFIEPVLRRSLYEYDAEETDPKLAAEAIKRTMEKDDFVRLLPGEVPGYVLRSRKWVQLDANLLEWAGGHGQDNKYLADAAGWKDLVLPRGHKDIVLAMVKNHTASTRILKSGIGHTPEVDLVKGKGKGCIILIHGAPGVGKTSTAECVAAYTRRPLFPITCGDVGYQPDEVETNLDRVFKLAHRWGCVLLLDEADVFLAKRNKEDIKRNGLVSIFLRTLEYYPGILFLTTNRVGAIDDAFRSRLHLTLYYPQLDREQSRKIWKVNFRRLREINADREKLGRPKIRIEKEKILKYADLNFEELHWNGRQIRNAFQSALALADFKVQDTGKSPIISVEQFNTIAQASHEFDHYLQTTHGFDEDKMAARDRVRGSYKPSESRKLKSLPLSEESESSSDSEVSERSYHDSTKSDSESDKPSTHKKSKKKSKKTHSRKHRKDKKDDSKDEKKKKGKEKGKGKEKAKESDESDADSDEDE